MRGAMLRGEVWLRAGGGEGMRRCRGTGAAREDQSRSGCTHAWLHNALRVWPNVPSLTLPSHSLTPPDPLPPPAVGRMGRPASL